MPHEMFVPEFDTGDKDHDEFLNTMLELGNANTLVMSDMTDEEAGAYLMQVLREHDCVWAIWPDENHATGLGMKLILDRYGIKTGKPESMVAINAIACPDEHAADQIIAMVERAASGRRIS